MFNLLQDLRNCPNNRLLELLNMNSDLNRSDNRNDPSRLVRAYPHRLTNKLRGNFALDIHLNHGRTGWRAIFGYDDDNNVIFHGIGNFNSLNSSKT